MARRRNSYYGRRKKSSKGWFFLFILILLGAGGAYIWFSPKFERVAPKIEFSKQKYWNPKTPINVKVSDNTSLGKYRVIVSDGKKSITVAQGEFSPNQKSGLIKFIIPDSLDTHQNFWILKVEQRDRSLWNFAKGNKATAEFKILIDRKAPSLAVVAKSPSIIRGGSALIIFRAKDKNLDKVWISAGGRKWKVIPYKKDGYYASLIAWPFRVSDFRVKIVATDKAGNISKKRVNLELISKKYKVSWIALSDRFLNGKIAEFAKSFPDIVGKYSNPLKRFKAVNETLRGKNEKLIHKYTSKVSKINFSEWRPKAFYPLKRAEKVASFGDERHYYYKNRSNEISTSYHLGYDLASVRQAPIYSSNDGVVVFADYNGIYGNMPIIDHGFGLYTIYGHCSSLLVDAGDKVKAGEVIAKTGQTGLALGDHLHFGILIQGVEVLPMDWMKQNWIKSHIDAVFKEADSILATHPKD